MNKKRILFFSLIGLDVALTIALLVISIIMLAETIGSNGQYSSNPFIEFLQKNTTVYFCAFVLPLFILLAANIIGLVIYVRKATKKEPVKLSDLSAAEKEALRKQLLKDTEDTPKE